MSENGLKYEFECESTVLVNCNPAEIEKPQDHLPSLKEIEEKFANRFTDDDSYYQEFLSNDKKDKVVPTVADWRGLEYEFDSSGDELLDGTFNDLVFEVNVADDIELENFKAFCELECGISSSKFMILFNQSPLNDLKKPMKDYGVKDGDCLLLQQLAPTTNNIFENIDFANIQVPDQIVNGVREFDGNDYRTYRQYFLSNQHALNILKDNNPRLANSILNDNDETFRNVYEEEVGHLLREQAEKNRKIAMDPFSPEAQRLIAEQIQQSNIDANMKSAFEYNPETFATVTMLYINCKVNGHDVKAFVDSGAQSTIMSTACAERCQIMRLVDHRFSGIAKGIGVKKIIGKIHMAQIQIERDFLVNGLVILDQSLDCLIGLDMLRAHQCSIDLKNNVLRIGTTGTETRFLSENEIPKMFNDDEVSKFQDENAPSTSTSTASSTVTSSETILPSDKFTEADIKIITDLNFERKLAIAELRKQNGDRNKALAVLFASSLKF